MTEISSKICTKCKLLLSLEFFSKNKNSRDGFCFSCKKCASIKNKIWSSNPINAEIRRIRSKKWGRENKEKKAQNWKDWKINNQEYWREVERSRTLRHGYNLTIEDYNKMFEKQNGLCAICGQPETNIDPRYNRIRFLSVDHNHETNKIRGLLCGNCNRGMGLLKENIETLENMIKYLTK